MKQEKGASSHQETENSSKKIGDIEVIEQSTGSPIAERKNLSDLVEGPLLVACEELYDKNIATIASSANSKDIASGKAYIVIDFDKLSDANKKIAQSLGTMFDYQGTHSVRIDIPIDQDSTWRDVEEQGNAIAHHFQKQRFFAETTTLEEMKKRYGIDPGDDSFGPEALGGYWVPEEKKFYISEEQYQKSKEKVDE